MIKLLSENWLAAVEALKADGFDYFDWLGCVDEIGRSDHFRIVLVLRKIADRAEPRVVSCLLPRDDPKIDSVRGVFAGARWHEREAAELFGVEFVGGERRRLLLNPEFEGTPLRKDEVLAARTGMNWPGAEEPGETGDPGRLGLRQVGAGWCLLAFPILRSGAIATRPRRRLTRQRWPSRR